MQWHHRDSRATGMMQEECGSQNSCCPWDWSGSAKQGCILCASKQNRERMTSLQPGEHHHWDLKCPLHQSASWVPVFSSLVPGGGEVGRGITQDHSLQREKMKHTDAQTQTPESPWVQNSCKGKGALETSPLQGALVPTGTAGTLSQPLQGPRSHDAKMQEEAGRGLFWETRGFWWLIGFAEA